MKTANGKLAKGRPWRVQMDEKGVKFAGDKLDLAERWVMIIIMLRAGKTHQCWMLNPDIEEFCGPEVSDSLVKRALTRLVAKGWLKRVMTGAVKKNGKGDVQIVRPGFVVMERFDGNLAARTPEAILKAEYALNDRYFAAHPEMTRCPLPEIKRAAPKEKRPRAKKTSKRSTKPTDERAQNPSSPSDPKTP